jgi:hypothetical protein
MTDHWGVGRAILGGGRTVEVPCTVEIERTAEFFFANAIPEGIELRPGDRVVVHGAPDHIAFGETLRFETTATVHRAGPLTRWWTQWSALFEVTELYHCGFEPKEATP